MDYESIVRQNLDIVYRAALSYCKNPSDAEDVVQNTFIKLLQANPEFQTGDDARRWLIRVAVNECKNLWKSFWRKNICSLEDLGYEPVSESGPQETLWEDVQRLPPKYRIVLHLYYYEGYSVREIAALLRISESNVQVRLMRARNKLKNLIKEESE